MEEKEALKKVSDIVGSIDSNESISSTMTAINGALEDQLTAKIDGGEKAK